MPSTSSLRDALLARVVEASPASFEKLIIDLLLRMGYGGSRADAGEQLGRTGDGGVDGVIREDRLGLDRIYLQAKRYKPGVPSIARPSRALSERWSAKVRRRACLSQPRRYKKRPCSCQAIRSVAPCSDRWRNSYRLDDAVRCRRESRPRCRNQAHRPALLTESRPNRRITSRRCALRRLVWLRASTAETIDGRPHVAPDFYPLIAVFRSALVSFCAQILAAPTTGSALPGKVSQPLFTSISPR